MWMLLFHHRVLRVYSAWWWCWVVMMLMNVLVAHLDIHFHVHLSRKWEKYFRMKSIPSYLLNDFPRLEDYPNWTDNRYKYTLWKHRQSSPVLNRSEQKKMKKSIVRTRIEIKKKRCIYLICAHVIFDWSSFALRISFPIYSSTDISYDFFLSSSSSFCLSHNNNEVV